MTLALRVFVGFLGVGGLWVVGGGVGFPEIPNLVQSTQTPFFALVLDRIGIRDDPRMPSFFFPISQRR